MRLSNSFTNTFQNKQSIFLIMQQIEQHINTQLKYNSGKNLYAQKDRLFRFMVLPDSIMQNLKYMTKREENALISMTTAKSLEAFYKLNQYYYFSNGDKEKLKTIYTNLFQYLKDNNDLSMYEEKHYNYLRKYLAETNPFAPKLYADKNEILQDVVCEEYNALLQLDLLHIDLDSIEEPVLDIGCGKNGELVKFLRKSGIEAFGFDRSMSDTAYCKNSDWFDFKFEKVKWGTIISNLGFSNHFNHHHFRSDGNYIEYAQTYMQVLHSLKLGGTFHYAPGLPFVEKFLDKKKFDICTHEVLNTNYKTTIIKKKFV